MGSEPTRPPSCKPEPPPHLVYHVEFLLTGSKSHSQQGAEYAVCQFGTDCDDCGSRAPVDCFTVEETCSYPADGACDNPQYCTGECSDFVDCQLMKPSIKNCAACVFGQGAWCGQRSEEQSFGCS